ncbi:lipid A biosynthesis lauroyl acyltransferase [Microvirga pudoricolor]|uniref:lipid A biosynthesis lauroyl acyltransferase n=1 Tax=Microvirga pudoricolor TaxID=2778729 RepID=UPI00195118B5|nr:lipid A biosynthesis lauroyl acyltransferase [Microvirga pudoricolor]MBM6594052.1 lipid A biosynthesis lauroyl acyltransferase [Microvirga pudoricolor]
MFGPPHKRSRGLGSRILEAAMVGLVRGVFGFARFIGPERSANLGAALARTVGPFLPAHKTALNNIRAVYPNKPDAEVKAIARGAWDNLGRTGGEYPHLSRLFDFDPDSPVPGRTEVDGIDHFLALRDDHKPGIIFSSHLANWELPAICAARFGLDATAVFRAPNDPAIARVLHEIRSETMGGLEAARQGAAFAMQGALEKGGHLGMLIDQHFTRGVIVDFMGRPALVNPILGKFARRFDCPVHGVRVIRLPGHRFRLQLTPPLDLPRDSDGQVNVQGAMQAMTSVVESWVRDTPEQWLWMHRRWRVKPAPAAPST